MWSSLFFGVSAPLTARSILRGSPTAVDESGNVRDLEWHVQFEPRRNLAEWLTWEEEGEEAAKARRTEDVDLDNLPEKGGPTFTMKASDWQPAASDSKSRKAARQAAKNSRGAKTSEAAALTAKTANDNDEEDDEEQQGEAEGEASPKKSSGAALSDSGASQSPVA